MWVILVKDKLFDNSWSVGDLRVYESLSEAQEGKAECERLDAELHGGDRMWVIWPLKEEAVP